jgi:hypothetical protein
MLGNTKSEGQKVTIFNSGQAISGVTRPFYRRRMADYAFANPPYAVRGERTGASARASAAAAPMASLDRPAAEPWLPVVVRVAAARRVQRLAAVRELLRLAGAEVAATPLPAVCLFPRRRWQALSWSGPRPYFVHSAADTEI